MVAKIKDINVIGIIKPDGRCPDPVCNRPIIVRDKGYLFIKNHGIVEQDNGEQYIKCKCGQFVGRSKVTM